MKSYTRAMLLLVVGLVFGSAIPHPWAQDLSTQAKAAPAAPTAEKLDLTEGSQMRSQVREQLVGINLPSDAVGSTNAVTGNVVLRSNGTIDSARS